MFLVPFGLEFKRFVDDCYVEVVDGVVFFLFNFKLNIRVRFV